MIVRKGEKVTVEVAITVTGRVAGGLTELLQPTVTVETEATHIPTEIVLDVDHLELGALVRASDLTLPAGTTLAGDADIVVLAIATPQAEEEETVVAAVAVAEPADS